MITRKPVAIPPRLLQVIMAITKAKRTTGVTSLTFKMSLPMSQASFRPALQTLFAVDQMQDQLCRYLALLLLRL